MSRRRAAAERRTRNVLLANAQKRARQVTWLETCPSTLERQQSSRPERKPGEAGLRGGVLMRRGDVKPRRAARLTTAAGRRPPLERAGFARARSARSAVPHHER